MTEQQTSTEVKTTCSLCGETIVGGKCSYKLYEKNVIANVNHELGIECQNCGAIYCTKKMKHKKALKWSRWSSYEKSTCPRCGKLIGPSQVILEKNAPLLKVQAKAIDDDANDDSNKSVEDIITSESHLTRMSCSICGNTSFGAPYDYPELYIGQLATKTADLVGYRCQNCSAKFCSEHAGSGIANPMEWHNATCPQCGKPIGPGRVYLRQGETITGVYHPLLREPLVCFRSQEYEKAERLASEAIESKPRDKVVLEELMFLKGLALEGMGKRIEAKALYKRIGLRDMNEPKGLRAWYLWYIKGEMYERFGVKSKARECYLNLSYGSLIIRLVPETIIRIVLIPLHILLLCITFRMIGVFGGDIKFAEPYYLFCAIMKRREAERFQ